MLLMCNHVLFVKYLPSKLNNVKMFCWYVSNEFNSRNARVQADYGFIYMSRIVVASNEITVEEETDKLIVRYFPDFNVYL